MLMQAPIAETSTFCVIYIVPFKRWWITGIMCLQQGFNMSECLSMQGSKHHHKNQILSLIRSQCKEISISCPVAHTHKLNM